MKSDVCGSLVFSDLVTYTYSYIIHIYIFTYFNVLTEYAKELIQKAGETCLNEEDKSTLPDTPSPLASAYRHFNPFILTL